MAVEKDYFPDVVAGAAVRDTSGKVIDRRFKQAYEDLDRDICGTINGSSLVVTLRRKSQAGAPEKESKEGFSVDETVSIARVGEQEAEQIASQAKAGFSFEEQEEPKATTFSLGSAPQAKPSGGFVFEEEGETDPTSFQLGSAKKKESGGFSLKIN